MQENTGADPRFHVQELQWLLIWSLTMCSADSALG